MRKCTLFFSELVPPFASLLAARAAADGFARTGVPKSSGCAGAAAASLRLRRPALPPAADGGSSGLPLAAAGLPFAAAASPMLFRCFFFLFSFLPEAAGACGSAAPPSASNGLAAAGGGGVASGCSAVVARASRLSAFFADFFPDAPVAAAGLAGAGAAAASAGAGLAAALFAAFPAAAPAAAAASAFLAVFWPTSSTPPASCASREPCCIQVPAAATRP